jgi:glycosyltransferase involved in cell wall biosynthesis
LLIDHFNTLLSGGAAVAAKRLHQGLLQSGVESRLWYASDSSRVKKSAIELVAGANPVPWPLHDSSFGVKLKRLARQGLKKIQLRLIRSYYRRGRRKKSGGFIGVRQSVATPYNEGCFQGDIVHFHWIGHLIDFPSFFESMPEGLPLVWSLHDMNPLTGGCSHAGDCDGFTRMCGDCPVLSRPGPRDLSYQELAIKHASLQRRNVSIIAPSQWMAGMAKRSSLFSHCPIKVIHNPVDMSSFFPEHKRIARQNLGLPEEGICLLYAAESVEVREKGINEFLGVLSRLGKSRDLFGLTFGRGDVVSSIDGVPIQHLGYLNSIEKMRLAYSAADIFVIPSHAETISQTTVEAFACQTPAVAFDVGGLPELVHDGQTGFLAPFLNIESMAEKIDWLIEHPDERRNMGTKALQFAREGFESKSLISRYIDFYKEVLNSSSDKKSPRGRQRSGFQVEGAER